MKKSNIFLTFSLITTFSILGCAQKTPKVDFAKKIQEATPKSLPQEPVAQKLKTDAQDKNFKGKVKSVIEYTQSAGKAARKIYSEEYYNENGSLIKEVSYDDGYPQSVTLWGYIDGNRVTVSRTIKYEDGERPPVNGITMAAEDNAINPNAPRDTRYQMKEVYKYDEQGKLTEDWDYQNNGEVWTHHVYLYSGNKRETRDYGNDGSEWSRTIEVLDKDGNIIERDSMDENNKISNREINTYEFDAQGNWTMEKTSEPKKVRGKAIMKLLWTSYRTITYTKLRK